MICKNCSSEIPEGNLFCGKCGAQVVIEKSQNSIAVKCDECGKFFKKDFLVCPFCGTEHNDTAQAKTPSGSFYEYVANNCNQPKNTYSSARTKISGTLKTAMIFAVVVIIVILLISALSSVKTCANCGDTMFGDYYDVFGDYWCKDCFFKG